MRIQLTDEAQMIHVQTKRGGNKKIKVWGEVVGTGDGYVCVLLNSGEYEEFPEDQLQIREQPEC